MRLGLVGVAAFGKSFHGSGEAGYTVLELRSSEYGDWGPCRAVLLDSTENVEHQQLFSVRDFHSFAAILGGPVVARAVAEK
jgi:hypothetical protein